MAWRLDSSYTLAGSPISIAEGQQPAMGANEAAASQATELPPPPPPLPPAAAAAAAASPTELQALFESLDTDHNGKLEVHEVQVRGCLLL